MTINLNSRFSNLEFFFSLNAQNSYQKLEFEEDNLSVVKPMLCLKDYGIPVKLPINWSIKKGIHILKMQYCYLKGTFKSI